MTAAELLRRLEVSLTPENMQRLLNDRPQLQHCYLCGNDADRCGAYLPPAPDDERSPDELRFYGLCPACAGLPSFQSHVEAKMRSQTGQ